ncbi:hypothetical protein E8E12_008341 [Didymella heteroderae]|uniref:Uncharacterized protein n=1 Tax=Didymella heteroderae TaxID=1769908 RepID=A0A9P4WN45_9PLEO|nr:hypothetical protein E8E12_008341 [Didymella heteroderae]
MLNFLINRALRKTNKETTCHSDNATNDEGFVKYDAVERRKVKESSLSKVEYYKAR